MNRTRALLYAVLVPAVPLPALALERGDGAASLDVQASLGGCGIAEPAPAGEPEPDAATEPSPTTEPKCEPAQEPAPEPVP